MFMSLTHFSFSHFQQFTLDTPTALWKVGFLSYISFLLATISSVDRRYDVRYMELIDSMRNHIAWLEMSYCAISDICESYKFSYLINASLHTNSYKSERCFKNSHLVKVGVDKKILELCPTLCPDPGTVFCPLAPWAPVNTSKTGATLVNKANTSKS